MNVFRKEYRVLAASEKARVDEIKNRAEELYNLFVPVEGGPGTGHRELALARTKLEESVMWATKGLT